MAVDESAAECALWSGLGLSAAALSGENALSSAVSLTPSDAAAALSRARNPGDFEADSRAAANASVEAARRAIGPARKASAAAPVAVARLDALIASFDDLDVALAAAEKDVGAMLASAGQDVRRREIAERDAAHVEAFVKEVILDPALVRHIVDGAVGDERYVEFLNLLRKKAAVFEMADTKRAAVYRELRPVLDMLIETAAFKVQEFLLKKMDLLRLPGTNVQIIKQNVLLRHVGLANFLEEMAPSQFAAVRGEYTEIMAPLYASLFARYSSGLMTLKAQVGADPTAGALASSTSAAVAAAASGLSLSSAPVVGAIQQRSDYSASAAASFSSFFGVSSAAGNMVVTGAPSPASSSAGVSRSGSNAGSIPASPSRSTGDTSDRRDSFGAMAVQATNAAAAAARLSATTSPFSVGNRIEVLAKIDSPAIVLAVAMDGSLRFYYEEILRSLGRMLSETCASEHAFCDAFFGDHSGSMFPVLFDSVITTLLESVTLHASASHDIVGALLALKVNEAQRTSMQHRNIFDLSHYFIRVDIALKPKFKKLFDANISSLSAAASPQTVRSMFQGESELKPHPVTRQFADLSASILAIAAFGVTDDAVQDGLRRMRTEFTSFLTALSAQFSQTKSRYIFLVNNIDLVLTTYSGRGVNSVSDARFFNELQVGHTAAYVEQEVADHFPDVVSFVRDYDRRARHASSKSSSFIGAPPSEDHVRKVLREFASNWHLGVAHMRDGVLRSFPNFRAGNDILRALFARLSAYHRRCETAVSARYPALKNELVSATEISYEVRQLSKPLA